PLGSGGGRPAVVVPFGGEPHLAGSPPPRDGPSLRGRKGPRGESLPAAVEPKGPSLSGGGVRRDGGGGDLGHHPRDAPGPPRRVGVGGGDPASQGEGAGLLPPGR